MRLIESEVRFFHQADHGERERGLELQRYLFRPDGTLTLTAFSMAANLGITRDVIVNLDSRWRPLDAYVRIHLGERVEGSGWFRFDEEGVSADLWNAATGLSHQHVLAREGAMAFSGHPIACDILLAMAFDRRADRPVQLCRNLFLSSAHHFGATGPEIAPATLAIEHVGVDRIETAAGRRDADHWRILGGNERTGHTHPGEEMWSLKDTPIFLAAAIPALGYDYRLVRFEEREV